MFKSGIFNNLKIDKSNLSNEFGSQSCQINIDVKKIYFLDNIYNYLNKTYYYNVDNRIYKKIRFTGCWRSNY